MRVQLFHAWFTPVLISSSCWLIFDAKSMKIFSSIVSLFAVAGIALANESALTTPYQPLTALARARLLLSR